MLYSVDKNRHNDLTCCFVTNIFVSYLLISDLVFDETATTYDVFDAIAKPIVNSALAGFNGKV